MRKQLVVAAIVAAGVLGGTVGLVGGGSGCANAALGCITPIVGTATTVGTTTTSGSWTTASSAIVGVSQSGSDSCTANSTPVAPASLTSGHICQTWNKAFSVAGNGNTIAVFGAGGTFSGDSTNSVLITNDPGYTSDVTFACGDSTAVHMNADQLWIETQHVVVTGRCFQLQRVWMGDPVSNFAVKPCNHVTLNDLTLYIYDDAGCSNVAIINSQIGPDIACWQVGTNGGVGVCTNNASTNEKYFFDRGEGNKDYNEPKLHPDGRGRAWNGFTLSGDYVVGINTRDPGGLHNGGMHINCGSNLTITNTTFQYVFAYDMADFAKDNGGCSPSNVTITGNHFYQAINQITGTDYKTPSSDGQSDMQVEGENSSGCIRLTSWTITANIFSGGYNLNHDGCSSPTYTNLVINNNTLPGGADNFPTQPQP